METEWFYTVGGASQQGPVPESRIRALLEAGTLKGNDLVWKAGMKDWLPAGRIPEFQSSTHAMPGAGDTGMPPRLGGWMGFVGVMNIILGILYCITCVGIPFGIFLIVGGAALLSAKTALASVGAVDGQMAAFMRKLNTFMAMTAALYILGLLIAVITLVVNAGMFLAMRGH